MSRLTGTRPLLLAVCLLAAACGRSLPMATPLPPTSTPTQSSPTVTVSPTDGPTELPAATFTPVPCDQLTADYCVLDGDFLLQRPIQPPGTDTIDRYYPYGSTAGGSREVHHGVEFENASGTPVHAAADGTVYYTGNDATRVFGPNAGFYGNIVILQHAFPAGPLSTLYTLYAHLSRIDVSAGQAVHTGEVIGEVGLTGTAAGSHLHFEVRLHPDDYASTLNPELWLAPHEGNGSLVLQATDPDGNSIYPSFSIQDYPDRSQPASATFTADGYGAEAVNPLDPFHSVASLGDQPAGWYRITFLWDYTLYERWVRIEPGKLTLVHLNVKNN